MLKDAGQLGHSDSINSGKTAFNARKEYSLVLHPGRMEHETGPAFLFCQVETSWVEI